MGMLAASLGTTLATVGHHCESNAVKWDKLMTILPKFLPGWQVSNAAEPMAQMENGISSSSGSEVTCLL